MHRAKSPAGQHIRKLAIVRVHQLHPIAKPCQAPARNLERALVPIDPKAAGLARASGGDPYELALHGGEDYQLLLAVAPEGLEELRELARVFGAEITPVGRFAPGEPEVRLREASGEERPLVPAGHDHFRALASS